MKGCLINRNGVYSAKLYVNHKAKWFRIGRVRKTEADQALAKLVTEHDHPLYRQQTKVTFNDFSKTWLETYAEGRVRASTHLRYKQLLQVHLLPYFADFNLNTIHAEDVQKYLSVKLKEGKVSPTTINRTRTLLREMFKHAIQWEYLRENPAQYVAPLRIHRREMNFLNHSEIELFLNVIPHDHYALFLMLILTGMRLGEALGAKWSNLDLNRKQYFVRESLYRRKFVEPKSETSRRAIDLPPALLQTLMSHRAEQNKQRLQLGGDWQDLIFTNIVGKPVDSGNLTARIFKPALRRAGIREIRIHDLRHTNAALRIQAGEHPKRIQRQLGHASIKVTLDTYGHLMEETNPEAAERLQGLIFKAR